jgi:hypothetical protein
MPKSLKVTMGVTPPMSEESDSLILCVLSNYGVLDPSIMLRYWFCAPDARLCLEFILSKYPINSEHAPSSCALLFMEFTVVKEGIPPIEALGDISLI